MSSEISGSPEQQLGIPPELLAHAQTTIIREAPGAMRPTMLGAFAGSAEAALSRRKNMQPITYVQRDPMALVNGEGIKDPQTHPVQATRMTEMEPGVWFVESEAQDTLVLRHSNTRLVFGEETGDNRIEFTTVEHRDHGTAAHTKHTQVVHGTNTYRVSPSNFQQLFDKGFPYSVPPGFIDREEQPRHFEYEGENFLARRGNTTLRLFENTDFNHLEVRVSDDETVRIFGAEARQMIPELIEDKFAQEYTPYPDGATQRKYEAGQKRAIAALKIKEVINTTDFDAWFDMKLEETFIPAAPEGGNVKLSPATFFDKFMDLNSSPENLTALSGNAYEALSQAAEIDSNITLGYNDDTKIEMELARNFPALSKLRSDFITDLVKQVGRGLPEDTTRRMIVGFDSTVIALALSDELKEPLHLLEYDALAGHLRAGIEIASTASLGGDSDDLTREIESIGEDFIILKQLREALIIELRDDALVRITRDEPAFSGDFPDLPAKYKDPAKELMFGVSAAIFTVSEYLRAADMAKKFENYLKLQ